MLSSTDLQAAADALFNAHTTGVPIEPLSETYLGLTVEDAYSVQSAQITRWGRDGYAVKGYKIGLTSAAMQAQLGVDEPDYGFLLEGMYFENGSTVNATQFISPRIEPEIAVILGKPLQGPGLVLDDVVDAVDTVVGALEIIDSRISDWRIALVDTIADNASFAGVVLGDVRIPLADIDVAEASATMSRNGEIVGAGEGRAVLGSPLNAVLWLANRLGEYGVELKAGSVVLPGSVCAAAAVRGGDIITTDFGPLGTVNVSFEGK